MPLRVFSQEENELSVWSFVHTALTYRSNVDERCRGKGEPNLRAPRQLIGPDNQGLTVRHYFSHNQFLDSKQLIDFMSQILSSFLLPNSINHKNRSCVVTYKKIIHFWIDSKPAVETHFS